MGAEMFHADKQKDGQPEHDEPNSRFSKFWERA